MIAGVVIGVELPLEVDVSCAWISKHLDGPDYWPMINSSRQDRLASTAPLRLMNGSGV